LFDAATGTTRLDNARHAINTALSPLVCVDTTANPDGETCADTLSVALLTFPTAGGDAGGLAGIGTSCSVDDLSSAEQLPWQGVTPFVAAFDPYWATHALVRGTPISVAFARADEALMDPAVIGNKAVLFLTDGEETGNCQGGVDVVAQTQAWNDMGINTHVVSLAGGIGDFGQAFNDRVAAAGGTGQSINPTSSDQLTDEITKIVFSSRGTTTCEITIEDAKLTNLDEACERGDVFVQSSKVPCDQAGRTEGFFVKDDKTIEIVGSYCQLLEDTMSLRAMFPCEILGPA